MNYQNLPARLLFFPWRLLPRHGTIAADTTYYPFGTRMFVPGYGWGEASSFHYLYICVIALSHHFKFLIMGGYFFWSQSIRTEEEIIILSSPCKNFTYQVGEVGQ